MFLYHLALDIMLSSLNLHGHDYCRKVTKFGACEHFTCYLRDPKFSLVASV